MIRRGPRRAGDGSVSSAGLHWSTLAAGATLGGYAVVQAHGVARICAKVTDNALVAAATDNSPEAIAPFLAARLAVSFAGTVLLGAVAWFADGFCARRGSQRARWFESTLSSGPWMARARSVAVAGAGTVGVYFIIQLMRFLKAGDGANLATRGLSSMWSAYPLVALCSLLLVVLVVPIAEEYYFRGVLQGVVMRIVPTAAAVPIVTMCFGVSHVEGDLGETLLVGVWLGLLAAITGGIGLAAFAHAFLNGLIIFEVFVDLVGGSATSVFAVWVSTGSSILVSAVCLWLLLRSAKDATVVTTTSDPPIGE